MFAFMGRIRNWLMSAMKSRWRMSHPTAHAPHTSRTAVFGTRRYFFAVTRPSNRHGTNVAAGNNMSRAGA